MNKIRTVVRIAGKEYPITSYDTEDYVRRVAQYVDRKISELSMATRLPAQEVATLTAVTIADDLVKSREEITRLQTELEKTRAALEKARAGKEENG